MANGTRSHEQRLGITLRACARAIDRVPTLDEFGAWGEWRQAQGYDSTLLPSVYIERYGDWDSAVAAAGLHEVPLVRRALGPEQRYLAREESTLPGALR
jgi:hypothetical protein